MSSHFTINGLSSLDSSESSATRLGWQIAQRVQYIVNQVARQKAGAPADEIALELHGRLRRMGVVPNMRELNAYADHIAALPPGSKPT
ncbi:hypothetical protein [Cryptosporangium aurantiacum]|uniref:Uncharacterized protein n=1 Tax=Cryptosporangium aurantiacum TaxID=134849 RepID=A0A1M7RPB0_9ACTN|nr:hypothetical protein [Cryptosporangium aurantiacum]SHN48000.1 hypothetical protein SAMN05443668_13148 [Cryptosporangium aurantiacum]